jgi:Ca2+-binding RTX toxin-like protein
MSGKHTNAARLGLEFLDRRDLPSATVALQGSVLVITGDSAADQVLVAEANGAISVLVNGQAQGVFRRAAVGAVAFDGGVGDDVFVNATGAFGYAVGGTGNDTLVGGRGGNVLLGGRGNDTLVGGVGDDFVIGESGDDRLFGGAGRDVVFGGTGRDQHFDDDRAHDALDDRGTDAFDAPEDESNDDRVTGVDNRGGGNGGNGGADDGSGHA